MKELLTNHNYSCEFYSIIKNNGFIFNNKNINLVVIRFFILVKEEINENNRINR